MAHEVRYLILVWGLLLSASFTFAQRPGQISIRFTVFGLRPIEGLVYQSTTGAKLPLKFNPSARSSRHTYNGASPVKFLDGETGAVVAEAAVPPDMREPLFLFTELPTPTTRGMRYQVSVIDDSAAKLGAGHLAILNLTGFKLAGALDKTELTVEEGLNSPVPFSRQAKLTLFVSVRGTRVQSYSEVISPPKSSRLLLILFPPTRKGALEVQSRALSDEPPKPPGPPGSGGGSKK
jgi:hypothetical protein